MVPNICGFIPYMHHGFWGVFNIFPHWKTTRSFIRVAKLAEEKAPAETPVPIIHFRSGPAHASTQFFLLERGIETRKSVGIWRKTVGNHVIHSNLFGAGIDEIVGNIMVIMVEARGNRRNFTAFPHRWANRWEQIDPLGLEAVTQGPPTETWNDGE